VVIARTWIGLAAERERLAGVRGKRRVREEALPFSRRETPLSFFGSQSHNAFVSLETYYTS
jgi:hypothetical protein